MVGNRSTAFTVKIEICMVGKVYHSFLISCSFVSYCQFIVIRKAVGHFDMDWSWKAFLFIWKSISKANGFIISRLYIPICKMDTLKTAMKCIGSVIGRKSEGFAI